MTSPKPGIIQKPTPEEQPITGPGKSTRGAQGIFSPEEDRIESNSALKQPPIPDPHTEEAEEWWGYDQEEWASDPFLAPEFGLGSYLRTIWVWKRGRLLWCSHDPRPDRRSVYSRRLERFRSLLERLTRELGDKYNVRDPSDLKGFINGNWLVEINSEDKRDNHPADKKSSNRVNPAYFLKGMALIIPGAPNPVLPLTIFLGSQGKRKRLPRWYEHSWLENWLRDNEREAIFASENSLERKDWAGLYDNYGITIANMSDKIRAALELAGYKTIEQSAPTIEKGTFWRKWVPEWRKWWRTEHQQITERRKTRGATSCPRT